MLFVSEPFKDNLILTYFAGVVGATLLELVTGAAMEALLKVRYWDYSNQKFNYKGYICLSSSVAWGFLTILMNEVFHPALLHVLAIIPKMADEIFVWIVSAGLAVDLCISVRDAIDLRNILVGMENVRKEVVILRKRADVVIAVLDQEWREYVKNHPAVERMDEIGKEIELRLAKMREMAELPRLPEHQKLEMLDMKERIGSPKDVIFSYYDNIENDDLMNKIRISKYFKRVLLIILGIFILYFSIQFACLYKSYHDLQDSIIIHENTTIQEIK